MDRYGLSPAALSLTLGGWFLIVYGIAATVG